MCFCMRCILTANTRHFVMALEIQHTNHLPALDSFGTEYRLVFGRIMYVRFSVGFNVKLETDTSSRTTVFSDKTVSDVSFISPVNLAWITIHSLNSNSWESWKTNIWIIYSRGNVTSPSNTSNQTTFFTVLWKRVVGNRCA